MIAAALLAALASLLYYAAFELVTEGAYRLLQPCITIPFLGCRLTEWFIIPVFSFIFIVTSYGASRVLPDRALEGRVLSNTLLLYLVQFSIIMGVLYVSLPDSLFVKMRFLQIAGPCLLLLDNIVVFLILPLPAVWTQYKKRGLRLFEKKELIRLPAVLAVWYGVARLVLHLGTQPVAL